MSLSEYNKTWVVVDKNDITGDRSEHQSRPNSTSSSNSEVVVGIKDDEAVDNDQPQPGASDLSNKPSKDQDDENSDPEADEPCPPAFQRIMDVTEMQTRLGESLVTKSRRFRKPKKKGQKFHSYIALCRRKLNDMGMMISIDLEVNSPFLRNAFAEVLRDVERINLDADPVIIPKPFEVLWYRRQQMADYFNKMKGKPAEKELSKLIEFLDSHLDEVRMEYEKNVGHGKITSAIAWTIFEPGEILCTNTQTSAPVQCFRVRDCKTVEGGLEIKCSMCQFNGRAFGLSKRIIELELPTKAGSYPITDLLVFPLKYHPEAESLRARLMLRGHQYAKIVRRAHLNYNGSIWTESPIEGVIQLTVHGRVMIDYEMYTRHFPTSADRLDNDPPVDIEDKPEDEFGCGPNCNVCKKNKDKNKSNDVLHERDTIGDEEALLCPGVVRGFALTDKVWAHFQIDRLTEIVWNDKAYSRLEMNEEFKEVIRALVASHTNHGKADSKFDDIISGKGLGLVFLLQGPPGMGKTLTAESVSEQAHRPLYSVTSGELGTTVQDMEEALRKAFRIAKEWEAILLLDEADVFLSKRSTDNLEKNAFVSVFLRLMEYYQGILFLTTNRAEEFDPAFLSRIHLIIDYKSLDATRRSNIWRNLAENIPKDDTLNDEGFDQLGREYDINGREIKNLLRTAWSLANQTDKKLSMQRIRQVAQLSDRYVRSGE